MEEIKNKVVGFRKAGLGLGTVTLLALNNPDLEVSAIIGLIAIVGISWQGLIDMKAKGKDGAG